MSLKLGIVKAPNPNQEKEFLKHGDFLYILNKNQFSERTLNEMKKYQKISIEYDKNKSFNNIPENVNTIMFANIYNDNPNRFPERITTLIFTRNAIIRNIPLGIKTLKLDKFYNSEICSSDNDQGENFTLIPNTVERLSFGEKFNKSLDFIPKSIKYLELGDNFNLPLNNLPSSLEEITFGSNFNQNIDNLPENIKKIYFGFGFNRPIDFLPYGVKFISFGYLFNKPIDNLGKVTHVIFGKMFNQSINSLPDSVELIVIGFELIGNTLMNSLGNFSQKINKLPENLKYIFIESHYIYMNELRELIGSKNIEIISKNIVENSQKYL